MTSFAIHSDKNSSGAARWSLSAILIVTLHAGLIAAAVIWARTTTAPGVSVPTILVDMSPVSASPKPQQMDVAPGPEMEEADAPTAPPPEQIVQAPPEQIAPTPLQDRPEVVAPSEQTPQPVPLKPKPEPAKVTPEAAKPQVKPKPVQQAKKPSERPPAPRTSAAPSAAKRAPQQSSTAGTASAAARASYGQLLAAHLQRFKQYPLAAKSAGIQGVATLSFTVTRNGGVSGARLSGSSGNAALDAETMAMIRRAQPLPSFPAEMTQASQSFTVPVRFNLR